MCGITLIINKNNNKIFFNKIINCIYSRGPDNSNYIKYKNIYLFHSRLSIQTNNNVGNQPYKFDNNILIYNGEIYNYKDIAKKYSIECSLDTDLILKLYSKYKDIFFSTILNEFDGIFSICILDTKINKLFFVRDMFGVKPLYYFYDKDFFVISSTIKTFSYFTNFFISNTKIYEFINFRQCLKNKTIINNVNSFEKSHYYIYNLNGNLEIKNKYTKLETDIKEKYDLSILENKINYSLKLNLITDKSVKIGCFLSGGVDSSYIYNYYKKINNNIYSYSIGFDNCNEFDFVNNIIKDNDYHKNIIITLNQYLNKMVDLIYNKGYPLQVPNEILISIIAEHANKDGVKILIGGEGADEIFHGYGKIFNLYLSGSDNFIEKFIKEYKYCKSEDIFNFTYEQKKIYNFFNNYNSKNIHKQDLISKIFLNFHIEALTNRLDSATMFHSIEARVPFLSQSLVKYVYNNVSINEKIKRNYNDKKIHFNYKELSENKDIPKYCFKKIAEKIVPHKNIYRKKIGFISPIENINNKFIKKLLIKILLEGYIKDFNIFNIKMLLSKISKNDSNLKYIIFYIINLEIFIQLFIKKININDIKDFIMC